MSKIKANSFAPFSGSVITISGSTTLGRSGQSDNITINGAVVIEGAVTAPHFYGYPPTATFPYTPHPEDIEIVGSLSTTQNLSASGIISGTSFYGDGAELTNVTASSALFYPYDLKPNTINITTDLSGTIATQITSSTTASYYVSGTLYSPSLSVHIISSSANVTSSIESQTFVNSRKFLVVLSASSPTNSGTIEISVYGSSNPGDGSVTLDLTN